MRKQILTFIVGILVGAIITTGVFLILKANKKAPKDGLDRRNIPSMDGNFPGRDEKFQGGERPSRNNKPNAAEATNSDDTSSSNVEE